MVDPDTFKLVVVTDVPFAFPKLKRLDIFKFVPVALVNVRAPKLEIPETKRFVVVTPVPTICKPPCTARVSIGVDELIPTLPLANTLNILLV